MRRKIFTACSLAALFAPVAFAQEPAEAAAAAAEVPQEIPELEAEISYVEQLVNNGYPDFADPVIAATKAKWPESEVRFFAIEIRGMLAMGQFDQAEKKIASLPDRKSVKYWAARLEVANNYYGRGQKTECMKIYDDFFKVFPTPPKEIRKFYLESCYAYGQLLAQDGKYAKAAERYEQNMLTLKDDEWSNLACETCDLYLKLIEENSDPKKKAERDKYVAAATKIADALLWKLDQPLYFGRAVSMKAHIEEFKGDANRASEIIEEYKPQLQELHDQIVEADPDGRGGFLKMSPLPECLYLQAKILFDSAQKEYKNPKRDDEKVKVAMFGPKKPNGKRDAAKGAFAMAQGVFLNFETSSWAPQAGELAEEIRKFAEEKYQAKIKTKVTAEQIAKVRAAQFREGHEKFAAGSYKEAIEAYYQVLSKYPEYPESIPAVANICEAYLDLMLEEKDNAAAVAEYRLNCDAVEGYLSERFAGSKDKMIMIAAGDAVIRLANKELEYKHNDRADEIFEAFSRNYRRHSLAPNMAASRAQEMEKAERYQDAIKFWSIIADNYTNSNVFAASMAKLSECYGKLGDDKNEIDWKNKYLEVETVKIRRLQAQFQLSQMYQKRGLAILANAETNATPETLEKEEKAGTAQIVRAIMNFKSFNKEASDALKDPSTTDGEKAKYQELREGALFIVGDCWGRMNRPAANVPKYRENAAKSYEEYVSEFPNGKFTKGAYVKLGTIYTALGNLAKAKEALDALSKRFPESDEAKNAKPRLAKSLIEMGMRKEGTEIYAEMLRTDGAYTAGQFIGAGEALIDAKSWDLANQAYERAIRLAGTNSIQTVARARLGIAKTSWKQGALAEARDALDQFLSDTKMAKMAIAADANFMLVEVASEQGKTEKDSTMRGKYFGAAMGALKKVRQYWKNKPQWEQDQLDLLSGDVLINRMHAEEAMNLKEEALETCGAAATRFQIFIQSHGPSESHPLEKMEAGELANLERAYASVVPLFAKLGADNAERVVKFGNEYLQYFPNGKARTDIINCVNQAKADLPAAEAAPTAPIE